MWKEGNIGIAIDVLATIKQNQAQKHRYRNLLSVCSSNGVDMHIKDRKF